MTFLLPPGIKGLKDLSSRKFKNFFKKDLFSEIKICSSYKYHWYETSKFYLDKSRSVKYGTGKLVNNLANLKFQNILSRTCSWSMFPFFTPWKNGNIFQECVQPLLRYFFIIIFPQIHPHIVIHTDYKIRFVLHQGSWI